MLLPLYNGVVQIGGRNMGQSVHEELHNRAVSSGSLVRQIAMGKKTAVVGPEVGMLDSTTQEPAAKIPACGMIKHLTVHQVLQLAAGLDANRLLLKGRPVHSRGNTLQAG